MESPESFFPAEKGVDDCAFQQLHALMSACDNAEGNRPVFRLGLC